jgi:hypothetical protein
VALHLSVLYRSIVQLERKEERKKRKEERKIKSNTPIYVISSTMVVS